MTNIATNEVIGTEISAAANYVAGTAEYLMSAGPAVVTVVACIGLGYILKALPFPNKYIPPVVWLTGGVLFPILAPAGSAPSTVRNPTLLFVIVGMVMGFAAWVIHRVVLRKFLDDKWFRPDGDTTMIRKETTVETIKTKPKDQDETLT